MTMSPDHYTYRVTWSPDDELFVGSVAEFPSLSWLADSPLEAFTGIRALVGEAAAELQANGEEPPQPLADRVYSGNFMVRLTPEAHRRLALEAAEQQVSMNRLVAARL